MHLFYTPELKGEFHILDEQESKHCTRVLRMLEGDKVMLSNGKGSMFRAELVNADPRRCELRVIEELIPAGKGVGTFGKKYYSLHVGIAPTKNINRFEWFLEKATEIGIDEITPLICRRSERKVVKIERLNKVITAAMKQSVKAYHPLLNEACSMKEFLSKDLPGQKFIAYVEEGEYPSLKSLYTPGQDALILIGPEGDFSPEEVEEAIKAGYVCVSLGNSRLRTETAGIVGVHTISLANSGK